jgi:hypothetical protein
MDISIEGMTAVRMGLKVEMGWVCGWKEAAV